MAPVPQVLVLGLDPYRVPGPWDPKPVLNLVHRHAPDAAIAFNRTPSDTFDAARRWIE